MKIKPALNHGFTLIELMIVVTIMMILSSIALPRYQDYVKKTQMVAVMIELGSLKSDVELCLARGLDIPTNLLDKYSDDIQCEPRISQSGLLKSVEAEFTGAKGEITSTLGANISGALNGKTITWTRELNGDWSCTTDLSSETHLKRFVPHFCNDVAAK